MESKPNYAQIYKSKSFRHLMHKKKRFLLPLTLFFLVFYFMLPVLTSYTDVLNKPALGPISWAWVFAFGQFVMTWTLCVMYSRKSRDWDRDIKRIREQAGREEA
ncbi:membrane protein [Paenibacillus swuensis]|uniref:Membrane protein n=1 Tax=Paenibacillus swuensis TaxID=1178515 RepID=A0A172TF93_9BACL|nr:DUF485 domain-containing protein [Paenibacillus swuensis]ANE45606.1 membrane protein [Paenibacillus swuensis]